MQALNCLVVEDEPLAADVIVDYISQVPGLALKGSCGDALAASELLRREKIDILFLDINLPKLNGMDFLKTLRSSCDVILTTAYHEYALDGFNLGVTDYLLKPVEFARFLQAVNKVFDKRRPADISEVPERRFYFFSVDKNQVKVYADEILYVESLKDYVRIHLDNKKLVTKFRMGELEKMLAEENFIRVHKSFLVNPQHVTSYNAVSVEVNGFSLPVGRLYKKNVTELFGALGRH